MEDKVRKNLNDWCENRYYGMYYLHAPSEQCKEYIAYELYASETEEDEAFAKMDEIAESLTLEDWKYLLKYSGEGPEKGRILQKIAELEGK